MSYFDFTENRQSRKYPLGMPIDEEFETVVDTQDMEYYNMNHPWNYLGAVSLTPGSSEPASKDEFSTEVKDQNSIAPPEFTFDRGNGILLPGAEIDSGMLQQE